MAVAEDMGLAVRFSCFFFGSLGFARQILALTGFNSVRTKTVRWSLQNTAAVCMDWMGFRGKRSSRGSCAREVGRRTRKKFVLDGWFDCCTHYRHHG